ncbi:sensor histidine kinase [Mycolicibacterium sp. S2-37]|uniref:ATP-binding protein n=1 Tax=Mycolicibacterium sp. S2-37 TaxID=2810297 RepID=UPI001A94ECFD|nr:ATP-binding protein [Mycolicibacterium sp. S2-37]MBO0677837.1 sensor histidine kinase [Mycolicibacterium sp. S2-37]
MRGDTPPPTYQQAAAPTPSKRPARWSPANWPVRWKVLAIVLVPLILAGTFGGLRIAANVQDAGDSRRAAQRAELIPEINGYLAALEGAVFTDGSAAAGTDFDAARDGLRQRLAETDVVPDVRLAVTTLLDRGQALVDEVADGSIDLRERVTTYAPLLLTAETAITGSTRTNAQDVQLRADGLSRAVGARGQMAMQAMLVTRGAELPEPVLRAALVTLAGTEPSTVSGMAELLGGASAEAADLRREMFRRMSLIADPAVVLAGNPELLGSQQVTADIADQLIADNVDAIPAAVADQADTQRGAAIRDTAIVLAVIVAALTVVLLVARSLVRPLRRLRDSALRVAHEDLPREVEQVRGGAEPGPVAPIPVYTTEEIGQVAHAVDELHEQAVLLAGEQSRLQLQVSDMFETLSRRSRSLVDQQLSLIDQLERDEDDPQRLQSLFRLDHLAARMRRNGANLLVLSGTRIPRDRAEAMPVAAIVNAAASEVEDYTRVVTTTVPDSRVVGSAAGDLIHLLAELLDNALRYSPPGSEVRVSAVHTGNGGLVVEVSDFGLGMAEADLRVTNARLQSGGEVTPYTARHMGLFVVGRLAAQHGFVVRLRSTVADEPNSGMTAGVYVPAELLAGSEAPPPAPVRHPQIPAPAAEPAPLPPPAQNRTEEPAVLLPQRDPGASGITVPPEAPPAPAAPVPAVSANAGSDDAIYQSMLSEWLIDPTELGSSADLDWKSVWDHGWSAAAAADEAPVRAVTDDGLPVRDPGARLVPGSGDATAGEVASAAEPRRDPQAVRASISSHFGGVHAGRQHARETRGTDRE